MPLAPKVRRFFRGSILALSRIQAHRRIERVRTRGAVERVMKSNAGKALFQAQNPNTPTISKSDKYVFHLNINN